MKRFPDTIHAAYEENQDGDEEYLVVFSNGVRDMEPGQRVAIYKRVDEGVVRGPKSFVSKSKRRTRA